jgi:hypothetical protein
MWLLVPRRQPSRLDDPDMVRRRWTAFTGVDQWVEPQAISYALTM